ncbi:MAG: helix-turn-helix transcriptional regulator [Spirochaetes bacterium]|nr:helix-turn-helix transcriptional regulator [Spirochaetota bacterium]
MKTDKEFQIFLKSLGEQIKKHRENAGLTQENMADIIEYKYFQRIENGKRNITLKTLLKISQKLNIHPKDLFNFPEE